ncbi:APC family permease [Kutzneria sp. 744]|uniref:APC family permease n=1 Tax=Kutzneria sp. (strain 744) TaxID=345341 RepID=UPI0004B16CFE|nr:APC family permease [Kutzneria sp. 744]
MTRSSPARAKNMTFALAAGKLGTLRILQIAASAAAFLVVVGGIIPSGYANTGVLGIPIAFVLVGMVLLVFCVGYNAMSRQITNAGALYAFISAGLGPKAGVAAAYVAWLAYNFFQVSAYGLAGAVAQSLLNPLLGVNWAWWAYAAGCCGLVAVLGLLKIEMNASVLGVLMLAEVTLIIVFAVAGLTHPAGGVISLTTLSPHALHGGGIWPALIIAITGYTGFEGAAYYAEEARDRERTVPAATYLCVVVSMAVYAVSAWALSVAAGPDQIVRRSGADGDGSELVFNLAGTILGPAFASVGHVLLLTSVFAAALSFHNSVARYAFALGREGVVPRWFGTVTARSCAPLWGSLTQSMIGAVVIAGFAIGGGDPVNDLFYKLGTTGGFGVLALLALTSAAIAAYFLKRDAGNWWRGVIAPAVSAVLLTIAGAGALWYFPMLLGVEPNSPWRWILPGLLLFVGLVGLVRAVVLSKTNTDVYARIGRGSATSSTPSPIGALLARVDSEDFR